MKKWIRSSFSGIVLAAVTLGASGCENWDTNQIAQLRQTLAALIDPGESAAETAESASGN